MNYKKEKKKCGQGQMEDQGQKIFSWECDQISWMFSLKQNWKCIKENSSHNERNGQKKDTL